MSLQHLKLNAIGEEDLNRLVSDGIAEGKTLEYKAALTYESDQQKREFLSDIAALANTDGGDLVLGMKESKGVARELVGLRNFVPDDAKGKIENLLRDFVQPRLSGVQLRYVELKNGNHVLLVRVPRSFASPHMVRHQGITRFCGRNSNGKYDLDVHELRSAFLASETLSERLKSFRLDRINRLLSGGAPEKLAGEHLIVLHILPVLSARADTRVSTSEFQQLLSESHLRPIASMGWSPDFDFEGFLVASHESNRECTSYVHVSRSGFLEAVNSRVLEPRALGMGDGPKVRTIPSIAWEKYLIEIFPGYLRGLVQLSMPPPYVISLSLLNVRDYVMYVDPGFFGDAGRPISRDILLCDELLLESDSVAPGQALRPLFDQVWNACGWHGSINYDKDGNWKAHR